MATRLRKGSRVEVMFQDADDRPMPPYSWRRGDLLSFNSCQFIVRLDDPQVPVQCVPRDCIRPLAPPFVGRFPWKVGNVVEVLEDYAWWPAIVVGVDVHRRIFSVCLWNSGREIQVRSFNLRQRKQWIHKQWSLVDKFEKHEYRSEAEEEFPFSGGDRAPSCAAADTESCNVVARKRRSPTQREEEELRQRRNRRRVNFRVPAPSSSTSSVDSSPYPN
ncbi:uncharacterized protein LOC121978781 [Zingiber officinale]|uniref:Agenet domain-containing protein n=1 Tax=Zingiber officinale TaxID=94328 RepID=A0A8J5GZ15_ZINOF|nr:uncharacterized protein LOC121978781 [Zingiber officinale]KAG6513016.1 hypothetical protein ZIOFF_031162 [Zingiber officinale]